VRLFDAGAADDNGRLLSGNRQPQDQVEHKLRPGEQARHHCDDTHSVAPDAETIRDAGADSGDNFSVGGSSEFSHVVSLGASGRSGYPDNPRFGRRFRNR
jgi:hypothetical protein